MPEGDVPARSDAFDDAGPVRRVVRRLVTLRPVAAASARLLPGLDAAVLRISRGRATASGWVTGLPIVELGTTGARSGLPRSSRVMAIPFEGGVVVAGAAFGAERDPAWVRNALAHPHVTVTRRGVTTRHVAVPLAGAERDRAFAAALALNPGWLRFQHRAGAREIPVLRLDPLA